MFSPLVGPKPTDRVHAEAYFLTLGMFSFLTPVNVALIIVQVPIWLAKQSELCSRLHRVTSLDERAHLMRQLLRFHISAFLISAAIVLLCTVPVIRLFPKPDSLNGFMVLPEMVMAVLLLGHIVVFSMIPPSEDYYSCFCIASSTVQPLHVN